MQIEIFFIARRAVVKVLFYLASSASGIKYSNDFWEKKYSNDFCSSWLSSLELKSVGRIPTYFILVCKTGWKYFNEPSIRNKRSILTRNRFFSSFRITIILSVCAIDRFLEEKKLLSKFSTFIDHAWHSN